MHKIILDRGEGKTSELIRRSVLTGDTIVCHSLLECNRILMEVEALGVSIPRPITYDDFINLRYRGDECRGFLIDNAELLIQHMTRLPVSAITLSSN